MLIEVLFRAPTPSISNVKENSPIYDQNPSIYELFFMEQANQMLDIQRFCALPIHSILEKMNIKLDLNNFVDFLLMFVMNLSKTEKQFFKIVKH